MNPTLQSEHITLRFVEISDTAVYFSLIEKNREYLSPWFPWVDQTHSVEDVHNFLIKEKEKFENGEGVLFFIEYEGDFVGVVGFNYINKHNKSASIGYWLDRDYQGKGIMTESVKLLISYGFQTLHLHRVELSHASENDRSSKIPLRLGFIHEGHFRESFYLNGTFVDQEFYGLLAEDWKE